MNESTYSIMMKCVHRYVLSANPSGISVVFLLLKQKAGTSIQSITVNFYCFEKIFTALVILNVSNTQNIKLLKAFVYVTDSALGFVCFSQKFSKPVKLKNLFQKFEKLFTIV